MQLGDVRDHRLGYQRARRTHSIATFNFLHHVLGDNFQQTFFAVAQAPGFDIEDTEGADR